MFSLRYYITRVIDPEQLNVILLNGLHDPSYEVLSMTVKACCNIMANLILEKRVALIQPVLLDCIQKVGVFFANQEIDLLLLLLSSLSDTVSARQMPPEAVLEALKSCVQVGPRRRN